MYLGRFNTQKEAKEYIRTCMENYPLGIVDKSFFLWIIEYHQEKERKIGCGIKNIELTLDGYGKKLINLIRTDDSRDTMSWVTCATGKTSDPLIPAMREAIDSQIASFRQMSIDRQTYACAYCKRVDTLHIDHVLPFKKLQVGFIRNKKTPTSFLKCPRTQRPVLKESDFKKEWRQFHLEHATLQVLCQTCNLSKGSSESR
jgi:5-methylcytosine-specific restriction endonuclease McrA